MQYLKKVIYPIFIIGLWINISETVRWIFLVESYWVESYQKMNLSFPSDPINGIVWMIWGFLLATIIFMLSRKFSIVQTTLLTWLVAFVMLWIVLLNINILPTDIFWFGVPLSLIEVYIGANIAKYLQKEL